MKRKITFVQKPGTFPIKGVATLQEHALFVGKPCPGTQGGGFISDMELSGSSIVIRKADDKGNPVRDWGDCPLSTRNGQQTTRVTGDGCLLPLSTLDGGCVVFEDVDEKQTVKAPDVQPGQCQQCGVRDGAHDAKCPSGPAKPIQQGKGK